MLDSSIERHAYMVECLMAPSSLSSLLPLLVQDLGRLLSAAADAWCVPVAHGTCRLPQAVLEGGEAMRHGRLRRRRHGLEEGEDYEGLSSLISLVRKRAQNRANGRVISCVG